MFWESLRGEMGVLAAAAAKGPLEGEWNSFSSAKFSEEQIEAYKCQATWNELPVTVLSIEEEFEQLKWLQTDI